MKSDIAQEIRQMMAPLDPARGVTDAQLDLGAPAPRTLIARAGEVAPVKARSRLRRWAPVGALALATASIAAATLLGDKPATVTNEVRCYSVDRISDNTREYTDTTMASADGKAPADPSAAVAAAIDACGGLWEIGLIRPGVAVPAGWSPDGTAHPVPALVACVLSGGEAAVFPGDARTCADLGLAGLADRR